MNSDALHTSWLRRMAAALLCAVLCCVGARAAEAATAMHGAYDTPSASLDVKDNAMLEAAREMGQWGLPASSTSLHGTTDRPLIMGQMLQRMERSCSVCLAGECLGMRSRVEALCHAISARRFQTGYYIYFRCQMRC